MYCQPWLLMPNRVRSEGGREADRFRGISNPQDMPNGGEEWVGSVTCAIGAAKEHAGLGLSEVILPNGDRRFLLDVIDEAPEMVLGKRHLQSQGETLGVLVKLLDATHGFLLQAHPTREVAKLFWNSNIGKVECWYVLSVRNDTNESPCIYLGFKPGITKQAFEDAYRGQTIKQIEAMCHRIQVNPGEVYFVPAGMPHALGEGCFVIEVQEPSDLTAVPISQTELIHFREKSNPLGIFQRMSTDRYERQLFHTFEYRGYSRRDLLSIAKVSPSVIHSDAQGEEWMLVGKEQTTYFSCTLVDARGSYYLHSTGAIRIGIVIEGEGVVHFPGGMLSVKRGSELFFPYQAIDVVLIGRMKLVLCHPEGAVL